MDAVGARPSAGRGCWTAHAWDSAPRRSGRGADATVLRRRGSRLLMMDMPSMLSRRMALRGLAGAFWMLILRLPGDRSGFA